MMLSCRCLGCGSRLDLRLWRRANIEPARVWKGDKEDALLDEIIQWDNAIVIFFSI